MSSTVQQLLNELAETKAVAADMLKPLVDAWHDQCATIATLTAELDALKAQVEWAQAANNGWQKSNASLATQVAVLREALRDTWKLQTGNVASCGCHYFCTHVGDKMKAALSATPADFDCIVEVVKAVVKWGATEHSSINSDIPDYFCYGDDDCAEGCPWPAAYDAVLEAHNALTPKAREVLK